MTTFNEALADHLSRQWTPLGGSMQWSADEIKDVDVYWTDADESTDSYGSSHVRHTALEIYVTKTDGTRTQADTGWVIENLLRLAIGKELNP